MTQHIRWWAWGLSLAAMFTPLILALLPPWVSAPWQIVLMQAFDPLCHQITERSPHIHGVQLAVCHRCIGVYLGLAAGPVLMLFLRSWNGVGTRKLIALSLLPLFVDWGLGIVGLWANTPVSRMVTGAMFGLLAGVLVARGMALRCILRK